MPPRGFQLRSDMRLPALFVCALAVGGCYASHSRGDDTGPPVDANLPDPVLALRRAWCESLGRCPAGVASWGPNTPLVFVVDVEACMAHARSWWDEQIAEGRPLDADAARACAAAFGSSCMSDPGSRYVPLPAPCLGMFGDDGPTRGEPCTTSDRCASGLFCHHEDTADCHAALCRAPTGGCAETCVTAPGALPASCDGAGDCIRWIEGGTGAVGAPCGPAEESGGRRVTSGCAPGLDCDQSGGAPSTWRCAAPPGSGEPCARANLGVCAPGTACTGARDDDTCEAIEILSTVGAPCRSDAADACDSRLDLHCIAGSCQRAMHGARGGTCEPDHALACGPSLLCAWETSTCLDIAPVPRPLGAPCAAAVSCASGVCLHGTCATSCS